ncbi:endo-beta-1,4-mannanase [Rhizoctonia solani AG-1 IA]|uniref:mannan endo-1,4-beta-mannosidase n=1 Tax=Thanatephorus cucumeris (strain AG1-IA) TaxID=983506 RepID=L8X1M2_THACA|nr:endo-beta-1,4-mannanase [Rhizoctonia solani AG-1 IA]
MDNCYAPPRPTHIFGRLPDEFLAGLDPVRGSTDQYFIVDHICSKLRATPPWPSGSVQPLLFCMMPSDYSQVERQAYNALPATITGDMWAHQYVQQQNQIAAQTMLPNPFPSDGCCTVNHMQGFPKFVAAAFLKTLDEGGLVQVYNGPFQVETTLRGVETTYPFGDTLDINITAEHSFDYFINLPHWAVEEKRVVVKVNLRQGLPVDIESGLLRLRANAGNSKFRISYNPPIIVEPRPRDTVALHRGALHYAYDIPRKNEARAVDLNMTPSGPWQYAIDPSTARYEQISNDVHSPVFDHNGSSNHIAVLACIIKWEIGGQMFANPPPENPECVGPMETIRLIPYGYEMCTSFFPVTMGKPRSGMSDLLAILAGYIIYRKVSSSSREPLQLVEIRRTNGSQEHLGTTGGIRAHTRGKWSPRLPFPSCLLLPSLMPAMRSTIVAAASVALLARAAPSPKYVKTDGTRFELDGKPFYFAGTNCYWCSFTANMSDVEIAFNEASKAGLNVIRTWGFNEVNVTRVPGGLPDYGGEGAGPTQIYYQSWDKGKPTINYGDNGLKHLDKVVALAEKKGIKLVVALTNNWADYGGMDVYKPRSKTMSKPLFPAIARALLSSPGSCPTNPVVEPMPSVISLVDPTAILPLSTNGWMKSRVSSSTGEEGFFNFPGDPDWAYNGADGTDFYANTKLSAISYGTFHSYPDWWSKTPQWVLNFTAQHGIAQKKIGKPVVWEEYGWMTPEARLENLGIVSNYTRLQAIGPWQKAVLEHKLAGDQFWQLGISNLSFGRSTNDGFTIYLDDPEAKTLVYDHVKEVNAQNHK